MHKLNQITTYVFEVVFSYNIIMKHMLFLFLFHALIKKQRNSPPKKKQRNRVGYLDLEEVPRTFYGRKKKVRKKK